MTDEVDIQIPRPIVTEGSAFTATAYFRDRTTAAASAPSSAKYRVDCLSTGTVMQDWTTLSPAASINIAISAANNAIQSPQAVLERRQLTVASNPGGTDQVRGVAVWNVENLRGSP